MSAETTTTTEWETSINGAPYKEVTTTTTTAPDPAPTPVPVETTTPQPA